MPFKGRSRVDEDALRADGAALKDLPSAQGIASYAGEDPKETHREARVFPYGKGHFEAVISVPGGDAGVKGGGNEPRIARTRRKGTRSLMSTFTDAERSTSARWRLTAPVVFSSLGLACLLAACTGRKDGAAGSAEAGNPYGDAGVALLVPDGSVARECEGFTLDEGTLTVPAGGDVQYCVQLPIPESFQGRDLALTGWDWDLPVGTHHYFMAYSPEPYQGPDNADGYQHPGRPEGYDRGDGRRAIRHGRRAALVARAPAPAGVPGLPLRGHEDGTTPIYQSDTWDSPAIDYESPPIHLTQGRGIAFQCLDQAPPDAPVMLA